MRSKTHLIYLAWILALGLLTLFFSNILDQQHNPNRDIMSVSGNSHASQVVLQRNRMGHYVADGRINGEIVRFLVDTGATDVAIPAELAQRLNLKRGRSGVSRTANGDTVTWATRLESVDLGGLVQYDVRASILPGMSGSEVLLGMSYLKHLELTQRGGELMLRRPRD
ncbi:MAG: TIGR02281 family clan AA aspartic protease [Candidatus Polarisedimenticolaceae bacterium]|nr:TIGR02281 family clan AA aspartic protease [Candidatus Polarisedimenticolaceae bacterium]